MTIRNPVQNSASNPILGPLAGQGGQSLLDRMNAMAQAGLLVTWPNLADASTVWKDSGKTENVSADEDTFAVVEDSAGNDDWTQVNTSQEPKWRTDGNGHFHADFDGTDDTIGFDSASLPSDCSVILAVRTSVDDDDVILADEAAASGGDPWLGYFVEGGGSSINSGVGGSVTTWVDGVQVTTTAELYAALVDGEWHILEFRRVDLSGWDGLWMGGFSNQYRFEGSATLPTVIETSDITTSRRVTIVGYHQEQVGMI